MALDNVTVDYRRMAGKELFRHTALALEIGERLAE